MYVISERNIVRITLARVPSSFLILLFLCCPHAFI
nr:MAG TPA_asm: hypothetical protein [Caudoviricetes sp.]